MIDYFYSVKITNSESVSDISEIKKLETAIYDMSSIRRHEKPVKIHKGTWRKIENKRDWVLSFIFDFLPAIGLVSLFVFSVIFFAIAGEDEQTLSLAIIGSALMISFFILLWHYSSKSEAWDKKVAEDRGITTEEVNKWYTIVKESDWEKFNEMISKKANDEIRKFKQLFDDGVISQEEFEKKKRDINSRLNQTNIR
jgi:hypothetical protein